MRALGYGCNIMFILFFIGLGIFFSQNGWVDLAVSGHFFDPSRGGFYLKEHWFAKFTHKIVPIIVVIFACAIAGFGIKKLLDTRSINPKHYIRIIYLALVCIIGPGLIVNLVFKEQFGRARPNQITEFGGTADFTPAFVISNQCNHNCSFVSGHASIGFLFFAFAYFYQARKRFYVSLLGFLLGAMFGLGRIMQGAHFLSDVIFSGVAVYLTAYLLAKLLLTGSEK